MFLISDTFTDRQQRIRSFDSRDIFIGVLLATMDFEWTLRRAIIALGYQKNSTIRDQVLARCSGIDRYRKAWNQQVTPRHGATLQSIVPNWDFLRDQAFPLRHRLVHGIKASAGVEYARRRRDCLLDASKAVVNFSADKEVDLYVRLPVRKKDLVLNK
jgi:hypothetical protein